MDKLSLIAAKITSQKLKDQDSKFKHIPQDKVQSFIEHSLNLIFPNNIRHIYSDQHHIRQELLYIKGLLELLLKDLLSQDQIEAVAESFFETLPSLIKRIDLDMLTALEGDPAAFSLEEVIHCYPGPFATSIYRVAHELHLLNVPILPRLLTEIAHQKTGIDIHPGAQIGECFFIDHGTGVVIGETSIIGKNVKIYQGVTLGALSVDKKMAKKKRHPTIEDQCIIYAHATILGGSTLIGQGSIIGGNVWLTRSIPAHSLIYHRSELIHDYKEGFKNTQEITYEI